MNRRTTDYPVVLKMYYLSQDPDFSHCNIPGAIMGEFSVDGVDCYDVNWPDHYREFMPVIDRIYPDPFIPDQYTEAEIANFPQRYRKINSLEAQALLEP